ncbi:MAG: hypothetical protein J0I47_09285 [Sphingomonas sp.]|uniref:hypothetical protein n=1 Tax=Sphingomonas sp. TaxID=28214 RepID=UPI001ACCD937|nr:hypothetical protein [Sphingomonas sp.]MBN8808412.1 hypothetical protein [Sphingomonas sp.]
MARWTSDGTREATSLFEAAAWHKAIKLTCGRCRHSITFNPHGLWWLFERKGWKGKLRDVPQHLYCKRCRDAFGKRVRALRIELVTESPDDFQLPLPDERDWKRAVSRLRT